MVPLLAAIVELAPSVDAGGRAPLEADGAGVEVLMPPRVREAEAPEASAGRCEAEPDSSPQLGAPEVVPSSTSPAALRVGRHVQRFGRLCVDFEELRKRKGSPSHGSGTFGPLKRRKYIAVDE